MPRLGDSSAHRIVETLEKQSKIVQRHRDYRDCRGASDRDLAAAHHELKHGAFLICIVHSIEGCRAILRLSPDALSTPGFRRGRQASCLLGRAAE